MNPFSQATYAGIWQTPRNNDNLILLKCISPLSEAHIYQTAFRVERILLRWGAVLWWGDARKGKSGWDGRGVIPFTFHNSAN
jgi:hypothetical protein